MPAQTSEELSPQAQQTRQHILETALDLYVTKGYNATSMRDIAFASGCSVGLAYRYFNRKEALVLALYEYMAQQSAEEIANLPPAPLGERFYLVMTAWLADAAVYREALGALFSAALTPGADINILGETAHDVARNAFLPLVAEALHAPPVDQQADTALILYSAHFGILLFWLLDRTPEQRATADLISFIRDVLVLFSRVESMPMVNMMVGPLTARLASILEGVFG